MNELMTKDNEWIIHFMGSLDRLLDNYERLTTNYRPTLGGERFFTDKEVSARLKVSRRTLQFCFTCKPFLFLSSDFPSVACFRCRMPFKRVAGRARFSG